MKYASLSVKKFVEALGSAKPAPGGGAAAALCAALGLSLYEMVLRINGRKHPASQNKVASVRKLAQKCLGLMTEDAQAFDRISRLYKNKDRGPRYRSALKLGALVPLKTVKIVNDTLKETQKEYSKTSSWLKSDLVEAELLLKSAKQAAILNVEINLKNIHDKKFISQVRDRMR